MTNSMIERVAKAIYDANPEAQRFTWSYADSFLKEQARRMGRAAIEAMREPTEDMLNAKAENVLGTVESINSYLDYHSAEQIWRSMIDEILK